MDSYIHDADNPEVIREVKKSIDNGNCIVIVGSGLSSNACAVDGRSPPRREDLLKYIVDWCLENYLMDDRCHSDLKGAINSNHLYDAAKELKEILRDNYDLQRCIRDITLCSEARICKIHSLIAKIPFRAFFTTNHDKFIETAYSHANEIDLPRFYIYSSKDILSYYQQNKQFIVKLNGDIDDPDSIILVEQLQDKTIESSVKDLNGMIWMISRSASLLFIGYNWEDPDFNHLLDMISKGKSQSNPHWIIARKGHFPAFKAKNMHKDKGISIVQYDDNESTLSLATFLEKLISILPPKGITGVQSKNVKSELIRQTKPVMNRQLTVEEAKKGGSFPVGPISNEGVRVFCSYAHEDEGLRNKLEGHLSSLKDEGLIKVWHDRKIIGGENWETELDSSLKSSQIILLLVSSDFLNSHYCTGIELKQARNQYDSGYVRVIPIILREVDWNRYPFGKELSAGECQTLSMLQALPKDAKPIKTWDDEDAAFKDVANGIRKVIEDLLQSLEAVK